MANLSTRPLTDEELRILRAVADGRMCVNDKGRYVIDGGARPARKAREALQAFGYISWPRGPRQVSPITPNGQTALAALPASEG
jgi:hypothetical protein